MRNKTEIWKIQINCAQERKICVSGRRSNIEGEKERERERMKEKA